MIPHNDLGLILTISLVGFIFFFFNMFTIFIIMRSKRMRSTANLPIVSFLFASALQALVSAPIYIYKRMEERMHHHHYWTCDAFRFCYFLFGHSMKVSLLVGSFDRLYAIKYPYIYQRKFKKPLMVACLSAMWFVVILVDIVPFFPLKEPNFEGCTYIPVREWGFAVIFGFNVVPFLLIVVNYFNIWKAAYAVKNRERSKSIYAPDQLVNSHNLPHSKVKHSRNKYSVEKTFKLSSNSKNLGFQVKFLAQLKATKTSLLLLLVYIACWGPLAIFYIYDHSCHGCLTTRRRAWHKDLQFGVKAACFGSSILAPIMYCWRTKYFRSELVRFFCKKRAMKRKYRQEHP